MKKRIEMNGRQTEVNNLLETEYAWLNFGMFDERILVYGGIPSGQHFYIYKSVLDPRLDRQRVRLTMLFNAQLISQADYDYWLNDEPAKDEGVNVP